MMRGYLRVIALLPLVLLSAVVAAGERPPLAPWEHSSKWRHVEFAGSGAPMPVRLVGEDEPWEHVVQDVQASRQRNRSERPVRVGFYGHGAFVTSAQWQADLLFVAALGLAADLM